jgi:hypothetical protein
VEQEEERLRDLLRADAEPPQARSAGGSVNPSEWLATLDHSVPPAAE